MPVRGPEGVRHFPCDLHGVLNGKLFLPVQAIAQGFALDVRHDVVEKTIGLARVVERKDMRVMKLGGDLDLAEEPLGAECRSQFWS